MPTRAEFETAAQKLRSAAQQVGELTAAAEGAGASDILRGGSLGRQVPERIAACAATARGCVRDIETVAELCEQRAGIIADYEVQLDIYDRRMVQYQADRAAFDAQYLAWYYSGGVGYFPSYPPSPPPKPADPPAWADVRRV